MAQSWIKSIKVHTITTMYLGPERLTTTRKPMAFITPNVIHQMCKNSCKAPRGLQTMVSHIHNYKIPIKRNKHLGKYFMLVHIGEMAAMQVHEPSSHSMHKGTQQCPEYFLGSEKVVLNALWQTLIVMVHQRNLNDKLLSQMY